MKYALMFCLLVLSSCDDYSTLMLEKNGASVIPVGGYVDSTQILKWKVGALFKYTVSKGVLVKVHLPNLKAEDVEQLGKQFGVDSWIIRVSKDFSGRRKTLGEIYLPMQSPTLKRVSSSAVVHFAIYYAAAAPSPRFENFQCPAFDHRKLIGEVDVVKREIPWQAVAVSNFDHGSRDVKVQKFSLDPVTLNGDMSLLGNYVVELSIYSERQGVRKAEYVEFPEVISISQEEEVEVGGCEGKQPTPTEESERPDLKKFKFGR